MVEMDEVSRAIGNLEGSVDGLKTSFDQHCVDDDRRHNENLEEQKRHGEELIKIRGAIEELTKALAGQARDIDGLRIAPHTTGRKAAAVAALAMGVVTLLVWGLETIAGFIWTWAQSHWH